MTPPLLRSNNFEGGANGATIATSDAGSGDPWNVVSIGAGGALTYDTTHVKTGSTKAGKVVMPASAVQIVSGWNALGSLTVSTYFRAYLYLTAYPASFNTRFFRCYNAALFDCAHLGFGSPGGPNPGALMAFNAAGAQIAGSVGAVQIPLNQLVRVEWRVKASTTVGEIEWWLFKDPVSSTPDETKLVTGQVLAANLDRTDYFGVGPDQPSYTFWMDDIAISVVGQIGAGRRLAISPSIAPSIAPSIGGGH